MLLSLILIEEDDVGRTKAEFINLFVLAIFIIGLFFLPSMAGATKITFKNCQPGTWVGGVKWVWGAAGRGVYVGSKYINVPELELKSVDTLIVDLNPGDYGITHYRPRYSRIDANGDIVIYPSIILGFIELEVGADTATYTFGCN